VQETGMSRYRNIVVAAAIAASIGSLALLSAPLFAQTTSFLNYRCADGSQFILASYPYDSDIYLQIDGGPVALKRRFSIGGARYSGGGITLKFSRAGRTTVKHPGRPETACAPT
jgi:membrane-bound inhibitor of C-type lysozyme